MDVLISALALLTGFRSGVTICKPALRRDPAEIPWDQISCACFLHANLVHLSTI
jgi:hypothetical protein